jgi:hypothetical protein
MKYKGIWKVHGLTLLLRVGTLWRCADGLFFNVSPLASSALLTTLHPLLKNVLHINQFKISCLGAPFSWLEKSRNHIGRDLDCMEDVLMGFYWSTFSKPNTELNSDLSPCDFCAFPPLKRELWGKKFRSDQRSAAHFWEVDGMLCKAYHLPREVLQKRDSHCNSTKSWLGVIEWVHKCCKWLLYIIIASRESW